MVDLLPETTYGRAAFFCIKSFQNPVPGLNLLQVTPGEDRLVGPQCSNANRRAPQYRAAFIDSCSHAPSDAVEKGPLNRNSVRTVRPDNEGMNGPVSGRVGSDTRMRLFRCSEFPSDQRSAKAVFYTQIDRFRRVLSNAWSMASTTPLPLVRACRTETPASARYRIHRQNMAIPAGKRLQCSPRK